MTYRLRAPAIFCALLLLGASADLSAQSTFGSITGTVTDPSGSLMVGVKVTVTNEGTNISKAVTTAGNGSYEATHLNPGLYRIAAESAGFQRYVHERVTVETDRVLRVDIRMTVGQVSDTVTVTGQPAAVESETATISDLRTGKHMRETPLNFARGSTDGGIFSNLALSAGAFNYEGFWLRSFAGARGNQNNYVMDGTTLGGINSIANTASQPSLESVQEMKVSMVNNSAEYGAVATVTVSSRSGTNQLHGSGFHQYSTGNFNARNFFSTTRPFRVYNQFGGSLGGPVALPGYNGRNRTFFFSAFEGNRDHRWSTVNSSVPSRAIRQGDFSQVVDAAGRQTAVRDPSTGQPFAGNVIPTSRLNAVSLRAQERFYSLPNFGGPNELTQNLRLTLPNNPYWNHTDSRVDHKLNDRNSMYGRFSLRNILLPTLPIAGDPLLSDRAYGNRMRGVRTVSVVDTHLISARTVNEARFGYSWHENNFRGVLSGQEAVRALGLRGLFTTDQDFTRTPTINVTGFAAIRQGDHQTSHDEAFEFRDDVTFVTGRHSLKVGVNFKRQRNFYQQIPQEIFGRFDFTGAIAGFSYADFLLGTPQTSARSTVPALFDVRNVSWAGYAQDDFKVAKNLTLNLGLRYEWMNPHAESNDLMYNFDPRTGSLVVPTDAVRQRNVNPIFPKSIPILTAEQAGFPRRGLRSTDNNNFDPRVGAAWRPFGHASTVLRSGFGVYRNFLSNASIRFLRLTEGPFISNETFTNRIVNGAPLFQFPEAFLAAGAVGAQDVGGIGVNVVNPYTMQWNLTAEQEYASVGFRLSYIATRSVNLLYGRNVNQPAPSTLPFDNNRRPFPVYRNITVSANGANSFYNALQFEAERKFARGVYFQAGWTWAKQLSHGVDVEGDQGPVIENAFDRARDYGDDLYQVRQRFVGTWGWELPFGQGRKWLNRRGPLALAIGGWRISAVTLFQTGMRFTPAFSGGDPSNTNTIGGRPDRIGNGNLPSSQRTIARWFDIAAFAAPPANAGRFGTSAIGVLEGPGTNNIDIGISKDVRLRERVRLEFTLSSTNSFNHPNFARPGANVSVPASLGRISGLQAQDESGPRTLMLGTRIEF